MTNGNNQSVETLMRKDRELQVAQEKQLEEGLVYADRYVNRQYLVNDKDAAIAKALRRFRKAQTMISNIKAKAKSF